MGRVKYFFPKKGIHLLTSCKVIDVTKRAPRDDNGNVALMAQGA